MTQGEDNFTFNTDKTKQMMVDIRKEIRTLINCLFGGRNWNESTGLIM